MGTVTVQRRIMKKLVLGFLCSICMLNPELGIALVSAKNASISKTCFPALFIFGDSFVDAGNAISAYPEAFARIENDPFGKSWPGHGADRFSDGRLLGDFAAWAIGHTPSSAYLRSVQTTLGSGANFAAAGATVLPQPATNVTARSSVGIIPRTPFTLDVQIQWLRRFKRRVAVMDEDLENVTDAPELGAFNRSLHIVFIGATDYVMQYSDGVPEQEIAASVPVIVSRLAENLETLHIDGANTILVVNLPPLGCTPAFLTLYPGQPSDYDEVGCLKRFNNLIKRHNRLLSLAIATLREKYPGATLVYGDLYQSTYDIIQNPQTYGFNASSILTACCGSGGAYNFSPRLTCGQTGYIDGGRAFVNVTACVHPSRHGTWDGLHLSEAVNRVAAERFFTGKHVYPAEGLTPNNCVPDFSTFK